MRAGRMSVLLVLAAVFSMHGLQCTAADTTAAHTGFAHVQASGSPAAAIPALLPVVSDAQPSSGGVSIAGPAPRTVDQDTRVPRASHASVVCLAVVTGLVVLGMLFTLRKVTASASPEGVSHLRMAWSALAHPLRPPDLAVLCLLRI